MTKTFFKNCGKITSHTFHNKCENFNIYFENNKWIEFGIKRGRGNDNDGWFDCGDFDNIIGKNVCDFCEITNNCATSKTFEIKFTDNTSVTFELRFDTDTVSLKKSYH